MTEHNPYSPPTAPVADLPDADDRAGDYFSVGALKLVLMSVVTFGLYELYWIYRIWRTIRDNGQPSISPFWRAFFAPLWLFSMGSHMKKHADSLGITLALPVVVLGIAFFVLQALWRLPDPYWMFSMLTFVPLLPFDFAARRLNGKGALAPPTHGSFSGWNFLGLVVGGLLVVLVLIGLSLPAESP